jgi:hypothetical protein
MFALAYSIAVWLSSPPQVNSPIGARAEALDRSGQFSRQQITNEPFELDVGKGREVVHPRTL